MRVEIVSIHAALAGRQSILWHGDVAVSELPGMPDLSDHEAVNAALFRFFNRVDEADGDRLIEIGYRLPSLSVGDLVHWNSKTWRVSGSGFEQITGSDDYVMALTAYTLQTATPKEEA